MLNTPSSVRSKRGRMRKIRYLPPIIIILTVLSIAVVRNLKGDGKPCSSSALMMDTLVEVSVWGKGRVPCRAGVDSAMASIASVDRLFGGGMVSSASAASVLESREFDDIVREAEKVYALSGGLFDPTIGKVSRLWSFGEDAQVPPVDSLKQALESVGLARYLAGPDRDRFVLDLGGIAKGYAVELAARTLADLGFKSAIVNAGGDMRLLGKRPDGKPWRIAIRHPRRADAFLGYLEVEDAAVATSGDYERCFFANGSRYHHILDPRTGMPGRASTSVTVVGPEASLCDALATALFLAGPSAGAKMLEALPRVGAVFSYAEGNSLAVTANLQSRFERADLD